MPEPIAILPGIPVVLDPDEALALPMFDWSTLGLGPCMRCGTDHERYGPGGSPLCLDCQREVEVPAVGVRTMLAHQCIGSCGVTWPSGSVLYVTPYGYRCPACYTGEST